MLDLQRHSAGRRPFMAGALILLLVIAVLLGVGCGGGGEDGSERAVKWVVDRSGDRPVNPKQVKVLATIRSCGLEPPRLEQPIIEYEGDRAYIELRKAPEELEDAKGCFLSLYGAEKTITLKRDLGELVLYDMSADPPEQRWPVDLPGGKSSEDLWHRDGYGERLSATPERLEEPKEAF